MICYFVPEYLYALAPLFACIAGALMINGVLVILSLKQGLSGNSSRKGFTRNTFLIATNVLFIAIGVLVSVSKISVSVIEVPFFSSLPFRTLIFFFLIFSNLLLLSRKWLSLVCGRSSYSLPSLWFCNLSALHLGKERGRAAHRPHNQGCSHQKLKWVTSKNKRCE